MHLTSVLLIRVHERTDCARSVETLLHIEIRRRLVEHEDVTVLDTHHGTSEALQLPS